MLTQEIILKRRHKQPLTREEITQFVNGIVDGSVGAEREWLPRKDPRS